MILCVDDEAAALFVRKTLLEQAGYSVKTALNGPDALEIFNTVKIDLVVSDHLLPGMTGTDLSIRMKASRPDIPILLLSGVVEPPGEAVQVDKFLNKSGDPETLLQTVAELLRYRRFHMAAGRFQAEVACDTQRFPRVWHCVVQRTGSADVLVWRQEHTHAAAIAAAKREMKSLEQLEASQARAKSANKGA
jgi:CheY-like chemotaxis protein